MLSPVFGFVCDELSVFDLQNNFIYVSSISSGVHLEKILDSLTFCHMLIDLGGV